jgi:hypothetical protein
VHRAGGPVKSRAASAAGFLLGTPAEKQLAAVAAGCASVIVCRASPSQKAAVVRMMMEYEVTTGSCIGNLALRHFSLRILGSHHALQLSFYTPVCSWPDAAAGSKCTAGAQDSPQLLSAKRHTSFPSLVVGRLTQPRPGSAASSPAGWHATSAAWTSRCSQLETVGSLCHNSRQEF